MVIDLIIVALLVLGGFAGYKKGLVGIFVSLVGLILSIVFAFMLQAPLATYLETQTAIGPMITDSIKTSIESSQTNDPAAADTIYDTVLKTVSGNATANYPAEEAAKIITNFVLKGISFVAIFVIVFIICYILQMVLNLVFDLPLLSSVNKLGGIGAGILKVYLKISILFTILYFVAPIPAFSGVISMMEHTTIANIMYQNNIFVNMIKATLKI